MCTRWLYPVYTVSGVCIIRWCEGGLPPSVRPSHSWIERAPVFPRHRPPQLHDNTRQLHKELVRGFSFEIFADFIVRWNPVFWTNILWKLEWEGCGSRVVVMSTRWWPWWGKWKSSLVNKAQVLDPVGRQGDQGPTYPKHTQRNFTFLKKTSIYQYNL